MVIVASFEEDLAAESMKIQTLDDLEPGQSAAIILTMLPIQIFLMNYITDYYNFGGWILPKGNRFRWWELVFVIVGFTIDDSCTAIGMQAEEVPMVNVEGNVQMAGLMQWWIKQGWAKTETAAHRLTWLVFMGTICTAHYFGWLSANSRVLLMFFAAMKTWAGYAWCDIKPNNFSHSDFYTFKDGRPTPERMSLPLRDAYNIEKGYIKPKRRRLTETRSTGAAWISRFLFNIFPI